MNTLLLIVLLAYIAIQAFRYALEYLNIRHMRTRLGAVPADFEGVVDAEFLAKVQRYEQEKTWFDIAASAFSSVLVVIFLFCGLLAWYVLWIDRLGLPFLPAGVLFFLLLYLAGELLSVPFALYFVFSIENKYGFNTMTARLWVADFFKATGLSIVLLVVVLGCALLIVAWSPGFWWFWVWCLMLVFTLFITYISPYVIEPLFNKFTPVEDAGLKDRIVDMASRAGIRVSRVLKMDASKRSRHTNAYFTGIGRTKRIVLFDTLLDRMVPSEVLAVLAHEIGHWKRKHLLKGLVVTEIASFVGLFAAYHAIGSGYPARLFGAPGDNLFANMVVTAFLFSMLSFFFKPLANAFSRRLEREADRFSCDLQGEPATMISVLVKLSKDNLSNLYPHPLYALINYSHPPVLDRIHYIRDYCAGKEGARR